MRKTQIKHKQLIMSNSIINTTVQYIRASMTVSTNEAEG
jgi:hypothetical protein